MTGCRTSRRLPPSPSICSRLFSWILAAPPLLDSLHSAFCALLLSSDAVLAAAPGWNVEDEELALYDETVFAEDFARAPDGLFSGRPPSALRGVFAADEEARRARPSDGAGAGSQRRLLLEQLLLLQRQRGKLQQRQQRLLSLARPSTPRRRAAAPLRKAGVPGALPSSSSSNNKGVLRRSQKQPATAPPPPSLPRQPKQTGKCRVVENARRPAAAEPNSARKSAPASEVPSQEGPVSDHEAPEDPSEFVHEEEEGEEEEEEQDRPLLRLSSPPLCASPETTAAALSARRRALLGACNKIRTLKLRLEAAVASGPKEREAHSRSCEGSLCEDTAEQLAEALREAPLSDASHGASLLLSLLQHRQREPLVAQDLLPLIEDIRHSLEAAARRLFECDGRRGFAQRRCSSFSCTATPCINNGGWAERRSCSWSCRADESCPPPSSPLPEGAALRALEDEAETERREDSRSPTATFVAATPSEKTAQKPLSGSGPISASQREATGKHRGLKAVLPENPAEPKQPNCAATAAAASAETGGGGPGPSPSAFVDLSWAKAQKSRETLPKDHAQRARNAKVPSLEHAALASQKVSVGLSSNGGEDSADPFYRTPEFSKTPRDDESLELSQQRAQTQRCVEKEEPGVRTAEREQTTATADPTCWPTGSRGFAFTHYASQEAEASPLAGVSVECDGKRTTFLLGGAAIGEFQTGTDQGRNAKTPLRRVLERLQCRSVAPPAQQKSLSWLRVSLPPGTAQRLKEFSLKQERALLEREPLLQRRELQQALRDLQSQCSKAGLGGNLSDSTIYQGVCGDWTLHEVLAQQLLGTEVKGLVQELETAASQFVSALLQREAERAVAVLMSRREGAPFEPGPGARHIE